MLHLPPDDPCLRDAGDNFGRPILPPFSSGPSNPVSRPRTAGPTVDQLERQHRRRVKSRLRVFQRGEERNFHAFVQIQTRPPIRRDTSRRRKDLGIIEAISEAKSQQWRNELNAGKPPDEINVHIGRRTRLPPEDPRKWRKKASNPVFYWG